MPPDGILVLSRQQDEAIMITDRDGTLLVKVIVTNIREDKVQLGFHAPKHITIDREEIYHRKLKDKVTGVRRGGLDHG